MCSTTDLTTTEVEDDGDRTGFIERLVSLWAESRQAKATKCAADLEEELRSKIHHIIKSFHKQNVVPLRELEATLSILQVSSEQIHKIVEDIARITPRCPIFFQDAPGLAVRPPTPRVMRRPISSLETFTENAEHSVRQGNAYPSNSADGSNVNPIQADSDPSAPATEASCVGVAVIDVTSEHSAKVTSDTGTKRNLSAVHEPAEHSVDGCTKRLRRAKSELTVAKSESPRSVQVNSLSARDTPRITVPPATLSTENSTADESNDRPRSERGLRRIARRNYRETSTGVDVYSCSDIDDETHDVRAQTQRMDEGITPNAEAEEEVVCTRSSQDEVSNLPESAPRVEADVHGRTIPTSNPSPNLEMTARIAVHMMTAATPQRAGRLPLPGAGSQIHGQVETPGHMDTRVHGQDASLQHDNVLEDI
ncbi:hypothetical protein BJ170DRAFT_698560 [Xylariales sp. AK1849]|nr:hypothetical protein BJ170DRAFT_698560 [Xylariales sp. AK1849]